MARSIRQEEPLLVGSGMLAAVAYSAERLLLAPDWRDAIDDVLMHLGVAAGVSRAYLIEVEPPASEYRATQVAEWCAPGVSSQFENPTLRGTALADAGFSRWIDLMSTRARPCEVRLSRTRGSPDGSI